MEGASYKSARHDAQKAPHASPHPPPLPPVPATNRLLKMVAVSLD